MPELQALYKTLLGIKLDRKNFQRKVISYDILEYLEERWKGEPHKAPYLYKIDQQNYEKALKEGFNTGW